MPDPKDQDKAFDRLERQIRDALRQASIPPPPDFDLSKISPHARIGQRRRSRYAWIGAALAAGFAGVVLFQMNGIFPISEQANIPVNAKPANSALTQQMNEVRGSRTAHFNWTITDLRLTEPIISDLNSQSHSNVKQDCRTQAMILIEGPQGIAYNGDIGVDLTPQEADAGLLVHAEKQSPGAWKMTLAGPCPGPKSIVLQIGLSNWTSDQSPPDQITPHSEVLRLRVP